VFPPFTALKENVHTVRSIGGEPPSTLLLDSTDGGVFKIVERVDEAA
jgi:hypothetical protein